MATHRELRGERARAHALRYLRHFRMTPAQLSLCLDHYSRCATSHLLRRMAAEGLLEREPVTGGNRGRYPVYRYWMRADTKVVFK